MRAKPSISEKELEALLEPKLRLFLSVDIVGSTSIKQRSIGEPQQQWLGTLMTFYAEFDKALQFYLKEQPVAQWKSLGDELIYVIEVDEPAMVVTSLDAFRNAVAKVNRSFSESKEVLTIQFKPTAWLATFPSPNISVPLAEGGLDFIGPTIDMGFRLGQFASPRRFVISMELVYFLMHIDEASALGGARTHYLGRKLIDGFPAKEGYPVFWLDGYEALATGCDRREHRLSTIEDCLSQDIAKLDVEVKEFSQRYFDDPNGFLHRPFLMATQTTALRPPCDYEDQAIISENYLRTVFDLRTEGDLSQDGGEIGALEDLLND